MVKKILGFLIAVLMVSSVPVIASFAYEEKLFEEQNFSVFYEYFEEGFEPDFQAQKDLLMLLLMHYPVELMDISPVQSFMDTKEYTVIPNVILVAFPDVEDGNFFLMIDIEPTSEAVQFILDFTGIPDERIEVVQFGSHTLETYDGVITTADGREFGLYARVLNYN